MKCGDLRAESSRGSEVVRDSFHQGVVRLADWEPSEHRPFMKREKYNRNHQVKELQYISVAEFVIRFWRKGMAVSEMLWWLNYMGVPDVLSGHPCFTNVATKKFHDFQ